MATAVVDSSTKAMTATEALTGLVAEATTRYVVNNPKSADFNDKRDKAGLPGGNGRMAVFMHPFPLTIAKGEGQTVTTVDGRTLTDFTGNFTSGLFGHNPEPVKEAIKDVLDNHGWQCGMSNVYEDKAAAELVSRFPSFDMMKFCCSGTEASLYAVGTARAVTGKTKVLMYKGGYHGGVLHGTESPLDAITVADKVLVPYSPDPTKIVATIHEKANELAAVYIEPIALPSWQPAPKKYLEAVRQACTETGVCLIFDEIPTSRVSAGGVQSIVGVTPDLTTLGKYFAGGVPCGIYGGGKKWMERHSPLHPESMVSGGTYSQNVLMMAASVATLENIWTRKIATEHNARGDRFRARVDEISRAHGAPCHTQGCGSLLGIVWQARPVFVGDGEHDFETNKPCCKLASDLFFFHMLEKGFYTMRGRATPETRMACSTALTDADYENFLKAFESFLVEYKAPLSLLIAETKTKSSTAANL